MLNHLITGTDILKARPNFKLVGRAAALQRLSSILIKSKSNSVIITGPGGVGISSLVLGLQALKNEPNVQFDILCKRMFWLDTDALFSTGDSKSINSNFDRMMVILNSTPESVLVIEDTFDFLEASRNNGSTHFINAFMSAIKNKTNQFIFETRDSTLDTVLKCHSDMLECTTLFDLGEPANGDLLEIVRASAEGFLTEHHNIRIDPSAVAEAIELTNLYRVKDASLSKAQPERTISLLDSALANLRLEAHMVDPDTQAKLKDTHDKVRNSEKSLVEISEAIQELDVLESSNTKDTGTLDSFNSISNGQFKSPERKRYEKIQKEELQIYEDNKAKFKSLTAEINKNLFIDRDRVQLEFSRISGISVAKLNEDSKLQLRDLNSNMKKRIFEQDSQVDTVCNFVKEAKINKKNKIPVRVFLMGPSGVGKSETPRAASELLNLPLITFNMADYSEKHSKAKLINCPPGYEGFVAGGGILIEAGRSNPTGIFLFDEIEKADPSVFDVFLSVLDNGFLNDNLGRPVSFAKAIFVFTSNIGQSHFLHATAETEKQALEAAITDLTLSTSEGGGGLRSEFLNRFYGREGILGYRKLGISAIEKITRREFNYLNDTYGENNIKLVIGDWDIKNFVTDRYNPVIGARGLPGIISSQIRSVISDMLLEDDFNGAELVVEYMVDTKKFKFTKQEVPLAKAA